MKKDQLKKCLRFRVRLRPHVIGLIQGKVVPARDDIWIVQAVKEDGVVELSNTCTGHVAKLGTDHIHHFDSDPMSETDGLKHGFFTLLVQVYMSGNRLWVEPLPLSERSRPTSASRHGPASGGAMA